MKKGKLYFCVGLPRSSKSTFSRSWIKSNIELEFVDEDICTYTVVKDYIPRIVVSGDAFRKALHGNDFRIEAESSVYAMMDVATRSFLNEGYDVLIDETCTTEQTLLRYLRLDINAEPIFFDATEEECIKRAIETNKPYLIGPIQRMAKQLKELRANWDETRARLTKYLLDRKEQDVAV